MVHRNSRRPLAVQFPRSFVKKQHRRNKIFLVSTLACSLDDEIVITKEESFSRGRLKFSFPLFPLSPTSFLLNTLSSNFASLYENNCRITASNSILQGGPKVGNKTISSISRYTKFDFLERVSLCAKDSLSLSLSLVLSIFPRKSIGSRLRSISRFAQLYFSRARGAVVPVVCGKPHSSPRRHYQLIRFRSINARLASLQSESVAPFVRTRVSLCSMRGHLCTNRRA